MFSLEEFLKGIAEGANKGYNSLKLGLSFNDFLKYLVSNPNQVLRTSYQYLYDSISYYGTEDIADCGETITKYNLFNDPFNNGNNRIFGSERAISALVNEIRSSAMEEGHERIMMLHGPVGTAKTALVDLLEEALKGYSQTKEGVLFRFNWEFKLDEFLGISNKKKEGIGFLKHESECDQDCGSCSSGGCGSSCGDGSSSCGGNNVVNVPCQLNESPLFLIVDKAQRKSFLEAIAEEHVRIEKKVGRKADRVFIPKKLLEGNLCYNCRQVYDSLMGKYEGDLEKVLGHIKVERFNLDYDQGLVVVSELSRSDAYQKVRIYANQLSQLFPKIDFISMYGKWASSNRGIIHFSDIFKSGESQNPLLDATEKHRVTMNGVKVDIDTAIIATTNAEEFYDVAVKDRYSGALRDRLKRVDVSYLLNVSEEEKIYERDFNRVRDRKHIAPHTIHVAALWAVLTRLSKPILRSPSRLTDEQKEFIKSITPLQKTEIYMGKQNYEFDYIPDERKRLVDDQFKKELRNASNLFIKKGYAMEEGDYGVSPRRIQDVFKMILEGDDCLNPLNVLGLVDKILKENRSFFQHLGREFGIRDLLKDGKFSDDEKSTFAEYYNSYAYIHMVKQYYRDIISREVKFSLLDVPEKEVDDIVVKYVNNVQQLLKQKQAKKHKKVDLDLVGYVEKMCGCEEDGSKARLRVRVITEMAEYDSFNPDAKGRRQYRKAVPRLYRDLESALFDEKKLELDMGQIVRGLEIYGMKPYETYDPKAKVQIEHILSTMKKRYRYCDVCSRAITAYCLKEGLLEK
ncbi:MAG: hypothetical protein ABIB71_09165 [Candidatus Woesearchaeota archaeon]